MQIAFSPTRSDEPIDLSVSADTITINGHPFDFAAIPEGATLPQDAVAGEWLASDVTRRGGEIHLTVVLPHGPLPAGYRFAPAPVTIPAGPVPIPTPEATP